MTSPINIPIINDNNLFIKPPFPPKISVHDLLSRTESADMKNNKRIPNAFIIYRMALSRELASKNYKVSLSQISTMASNMWKNELDEVKQAYIKLSNDAKALYKDLQKKNNTMVEAANNEDSSNILDLCNNAITNDPGVNQIFSQNNDQNLNLNVSNIVEQSNTIIEPCLSLPEFSPPENILFSDLFNNTNSCSNNLITTENNNRFTVFERIRVLENRQQLLAELLGIQF